MGEGSSHRLLDNGRWELFCWGDDRVSAPGGYRLRADLCKRSKGR